MKITQLLITLLIANCTVMMGSSSKKTVGKEKQTILSGVVIDRPESNELWLIPYGEDFRTKPYTTIPIVNGKFDYKLSDQSHQLYTLCFGDEVKNGAMRPISFVSNHDQVKFTLYPMDKAVQNKVEGKINDEFTLINQYIMNNPDLQALYIKRNTLEKSNNWFSAKALEIINQLNDNKLSRAQRDSCFKIFSQLSESEKLTKDAQDFTTTMEKLIKQLEGEQFSMLETNKDEASLQFISMQLKNSIIYQKGRNAEQYIDLFKRSYRNYPDKTLVKQVESLIAQITQTIAVGKSYIPFTAPDLQGKQHNIAPLISKNKLTLLDFWGSWCGSCLRNSQALIPIYEKYKDKGFNVIGIAREKENTKAMAAAIERIKMPWLNLVELNDNQNLWHQYGIGNAGGGIFLVDQQGKIIAVSPSVEEVEKILVEMGKVGFESIDFINVF